MIVEGRNDETFLEEIVSKSTNLGLSPKFYQNIGISTNKKDNETIMIRKLTEKNCPYNMLAKIEGGHDFVIRLFTNVVINFLTPSNDLYLTALFNHDGRDPENEVEQIRNDVKSRTSGKTDFRSTHSKKLVSGFTRRDFELFKYVGNNTFPISNFTFVTFDQSLESLTSAALNKPELSLEEIDFRKFASRFKMDDLTKC